MLAASLQVSGSPVIPTTIDLGGGESSQSRHTPQTQVTSALEEHTWLRGCEHRDTKEKRVEATLFWVGGGGAWELLYPKIKE